MSKAATIRSGSPCSSANLLRIVGHPRYPDSPGPPSTVAPTLAAIRALPGHSFWPDGISMVDPAFFDTAALSSHARVTDSYLLALARANKGKLATMDHKLATEVVAGGKSALEVI